MLTISAVFENGIFRPDSPVDLPSGARVDLTVAEPQDDPVAIMEARFPNSFGGLSDEDAEEMRKAIEEDCERIDLDAWK